MFDGDYGRRATKQDLMARQDHSGLCSLPLSAIDLCRLHIICSLRDIDLDSSPLLIAVLPLTHSFRDSVCKSGPCLLAQRSSLEGSLAFYFQRDLFSLPAVVDLDLCLVDAKLALVISAMLDVALMGKSTDRFYH